MKKIFLLATAFAFTMGAMAQAISPDAVIKMNTEKYDFGKIKQGVPVTYTFEIKNISDKPVVVEKASASCGCTTPETPTEPIMPGETGKIKVQYSGAGSGVITKDVYIKLAGIEQQKIVHITADVVAPEQAPAETVPVPAKPASPVKSGN
jgi:hypothetical protein